MAASVHAAHDTPAASRKPLFVNVSGDDAPVPKPKLLSINIASPCDPTDGDFETPVTCLCQPRPPYSGCSISTPATNPYTPNPFTPARTNPYTPVATTHHGTPSSCPCKTCPSAKFSQYSPCPARALDSLGFKPSPRPPTRVSTLSPCLSPCASNALARLDHSPDAHSDDANIDTETRYEFGVAPADDTATTTTKPSPPKHLFIVVAEDKLPEAIPSTSEKPIWDEGRRLGLVVTQHSNTSQVPTPVSPIQRRRHGDSVASSPGTPRRRNGGGSAFASPRTPRRRNLPSTPTPRTRGGSSLPSTPRARSGRASSDASSSAA